METGEITENPGRLSAPGFKHKHLNGTDDWGRGVPAAASPPTGSPLQYSPALRRVTTGFGMGPGGATALSATGTPRPPTSAPLKFVLTARNATRSARILVGCVMRAHPSSCPAALVVVVRRGSRRDPTGHPAWGTEPVQR